MQVEPAAHYSGYLMYLSTIHFDSAHFTDPLHDVNDRGCVSATRECKPQSFLFLFVIQTCMHTVRTPIDPPLLFQKKHIQFKPPPKS